MKQHFYQLTLVTNKGNTPLAPYLKFIEGCLKGGITCVQLREKSLSEEELLVFGTALKGLLDLYDVPLIVNDNVELCIKLKAAGVHLGQSDMAVQKARAALGPDKMIGLSVNTIDQVQGSINLPIDYIGVGAIFSTRNKPDIETLWGLDGLKKAAHLAAHPIVAIGGIDENNALSIMHAGGHGIAAIGAFHEAADPISTTQKLIQIIQGRHYDR